MNYICIFSWDQLALWMGQSLRPSVCLSFHPSPLFDFVPIIVSSWNFQELLPMTTVTSIQKVKVRGQRSRLQVNTQLSRFQNLTPVWIHIWSWMMPRAWCCLGKVPYCFSRSSVNFQGHTAKKIIDFDPNWAFPDCHSSFNSEWL